MTRHRDWSKKLEKYVYSMSWDLVPKLVVANIITIGVIYLVFKHSEVVIDRQILNFNKTRTVFRVNFY